MEFILGIFTVIGAFITIIVTLAGISVWLETKLEEADKKETVMDQLPKVDTDSFAAKWANWMANEVKQENIPGTIEYQRKYQPK